MRTVSRRHSKRTSVKHRAKHHKKSHKKSRGKRAGFHGKHGGKKSQKRHTRRIHRAKGGSGPACPTWPAAGENCIPQPSAYNGPYGPIAIHKMAGVYPKQV